MTKAVKYTFTLDDLVLPTIQFDGKAQKIRVGFRAAELGAEDADTFVTRWTVSDKPMKGATKYTRMPEHDWRAGAGIGMMLAYGRTPGDDEDFGICTRWMKRLYEQSPAALWFKRLPDPID